MPLSAVQPEHYDRLLREKADRVSNMMAAFKPPPAEVYASPATGFRMRAEFRMWHQGDALDYVMFRRDDARTPVPINDFPIACHTIQALMWPLRSALQANPELRRKLFQVEFLSTLAGDTVITLVYHRKLETEWETEAAQLLKHLQTISPSLSLIGRSRKQKRVLGREWVCERLPINGRSYTYQQYEQAFTQPNAMVNTQMIEWACAQAAQLDGDLLELYCGNGNFTLPLADCFDEVVATELAKVSVRAARENLAANGVNNVHIIRLAAEEVTEAMQGEREFRRLAELPKPLADYDLRSVFVDPPRAGLDARTVAMVSGFESIMYISCNPQTLVANLHELSRTHSIARFALFDQFPYTEHMECGVLLTRR